MGVTVIIPCWNHGRLLPATLASVAAQTVQPSQIIVVDDGSLDDSVEVAHRHAGVTVVRQEHSGAAAARNTGVAAARSELIAFLDADDLWPPTSLSGRIAALREQKADGSFGVVEEFIDSPQLSGSARPKSAARLPGSILVTRDSLSRVGPFDTSLSAGEAIDWVARFDKAGLRWCAVDEVVLKRRVHATNSTRDAALRHDLLRVARRAVAANRATS